MRKIMGLLVPLAVLAASCGDDGREEASTWCEAAEQVADLGDQAGSADDWRDIAAIYEDGTDLAPEEIRADVELSAAYFAAVATGLDVTDGDVQAAVTAADATGDYTGLPEAASRIGEYNAAECGIEAERVDPDPPAGGNGDPDALLSDSQITQLAQTFGATPEQTRCLVDALEPIAAEMTQADFVQAAEDCGIERP